MPQRGFYFNTKLACQKRYHALVGLAGRSLDLSHSRVSGIQVCIGVHTGNGRYNSLEGLEKAVETAWDNIKDECVVELYLARVHAYWRLESNKEGQFRIKVVAKIM